MKYENSKLHQNVDLLGATILLMYQNNQVTSTTYALELHKDITTNYYERTMGYLKNPHITDLLCSVTINSHKGNYSSEIMLLPTKYLIYN